MHISLLIFRVVQPTIRNVGVNQYPACQSIQCGPHIRSITGCTDCGVGPSAIIFWIWTDVRRARIAHPLSYHNPDICSCQRKADVMVLLLALASAVEALQAKCHFLCWGCSCLCLSVFLAGFHSLLACYFIFILSLASLIIVVVSVACL